MSIISNPFVAIGSLLKIMDWHGTNELLLFGLIRAVILVLSSIRGPF